MFAYLFPWATKRPKMTSLVAGLLLVAFGHLFETYGLLTPLASFTNYVQRSLESFDALRLGNVFYLELTGCELAANGVACEPGSDSVEDLQNTLEGQRGNGLIGTILVAVINTVSEVFSGSTWLGIIFYGLALAAATAILLSIAGGMGGFFGFLVFVVVVPALGSVIALAMKWVLLLFVLLFSEVLAGVAWVVFTFGGYIAWAQMGHQALSHAHQLDNLASPTGNVSSASKMSPDQSPPHKIG